MKKIGAILLAAGNSTRFGSNKLLYSIEGKPMVQRCMELASEVSFQKRVIVTQYQEVKELAAAQRISCVKNSHPELGISHSIRLGVEALAEMDGWLFLVCDQPWLKVATVQRLVERYQETSRGIAALRCGEDIGNPVIFSKSYRRELENLTGDKGGKRILLAHMTDAVFVEAEKKELEDMDEIQ